MTFYRLDEPEGRRRWEALQATQTSPFAHPEVLLGLAGLFDRNVEIVEVETAGRLTAVALLVRRIGPWRWATHPPLLPESPLIAPNASSSLLPDRLLQALSRRYVRVDLHLPSEYMDVRPALWHGWRAYPLYTYEIDLERTTPARWSENPRRLFRKAAATYRLIEDAQLAPTLVHLMAAGYRRHHRPPPAPTDRLTTLLETLTATGSVRVFGLQNLHGQIEAAVALMTHPPRAWYWLAGSKPGPAMTVLLGHLWAQLRAEGYQQFDFVGANTPSLAEFKRRFNPTLRLYFRLTYDRSFLQTLLRHVPGLR